MPLRSKVLAMTAIPVIVLAVAVVLAVSSASQTVRTNAEVDRTHEVQHDLSAVHVDLLTAESAVRGYIVTGNQSFLDQYRIAVRRLPDDVTSLGSVVMEPLQRTRFQLLQGLIEERIDTLREVKRLSGAQTATERNRLRTWLLHGQTISESILALTEQMTATEVALTAAGERAREAAFRRSYLVEVLLMPAALLAATVLVAGSTARIVRRIRAMQENTERLQHGVPLAQPEGPDDELGQLSRALVRTGTQVIELQDELRHLATEDPLTCLANRRGFFALAEHQLLVAARTRCAVALLFVDVDRLKRVNDELGHSMGDALLVEVADILRETIRSADLAGRLGGDEFCVLLMGDPELDVDRAVQRIWGTAAEHNTRPGRRYEVSLSVGVSALPPGRAVTLEELIDAADEGMYEDKRAKQPDQAASSA